MATRRLFLALAATLLWAGCTDDDTTGPSVPEPTIFSGTLIRVEDETPMAGIEVTLFEPRSRLALGRDVTDSAGGFEFLDVIPGSCIPVVHSTTYRPVFLPQAQWLVEEGDQIHVMLRMRPIAGTAIDDGIMLRGQVIDDVTGEPIENARIEMNILGGGELAEVDWSEYTGWSNELETTSDADGRYEIGPAIMRLDVTGVQLQTPQHRIVAPGYRGKTMPRVADPSVTEVTLPPARMIRGEDTGVISGRVLDRFGQPMAEVAVAAEWRRSDLVLPRSFSPGGLDLPDRILISDQHVYSDAEGRFEITGLPEGFCNVLAGPYPDDGFVGIVDSGVEVLAAAGDGIVLRAFPVIVPTAPLEGEILDDLPERLEWEPIPDATIYLLRLTRARDGQRVVHSATDPWFMVDAAAGFFSGPDSYIWEVLARDALGGGIGLTDRPQVFHVVEPD